MKTPTPLLAARGVSAHAESKTLLQDVDIAVQAGEVLGLLGPNGAGKTSLLRVLAGVLEADAGETFIGEQPMSAVSRQERARSVAYLAQDAEVHWPLSVTSVVALGRLPHRRGLAALSATDNDAIARALRSTQTLQLADRRLNTLSGGERMRVLVARMLATEADVLLADEPVTGLDPFFQLEFMDLFTNEAAAGRGVVLVLHDLALALRYCDRVVLLDGGRVAAEGTPASVLTEAALQQTYGVTSVSGTHEGQPYVLPWRRQHVELDV